MQYRLVVITFITGLLVTGCSGGNNADYDAKMAQYKSCYDAYLNGPLRKGQMATGGEEAAYAMKMAEVECSQYKP